LPPETGGALGRRPRLPPRSSAATGGRDGAGLGKVSAFGPKTGPSAVAGTQAFTEYFRPNAISRRYDNLSLNVLHGAAELLLNVSRIPFSSLNPLGVCQMAKLVAFLKNESGATAIEYGLIAAGISVAIIAIVNTLGSTLNTKFTSISTQLK